MPRDFTYNGLLESGHGAEALEFFYRILIWEDPSYPPSHNSRIRWPTELPLRGSLARGYDSNANEANV